MFKTYDTEVAKRFTIYNSLFLDLPFDDIYRTGTLLPILGTACQEGFQSGLTPREIIAGFFEEMFPTATEKEQSDLLFQMIQYIERQVVLFDSIVIFVNSSFLIIRIFNLAKFITYRK